MLIDCEGCAVRGLRCGECVVTVLLGASPDGVRLDAAETRALAALAAGGLVPRLQLITERPGPGHGGSPGPDAPRRAG